MISGTELGLLVSLRVKLHIYNTHWRPYFKIFCPPLCCLLYLVDIIVSVYIANYFYLQIDLTQQGHF